MANAKKETINLLSMFNYSSVLGRKAAIMALPDYNIAAYWTSFAFAAMNCLPNSGYCAGIIARPSDRFQRPVSSLLRRLLAIQTYESRRHKPQFPSPAARL